MFNLFGNIMQKERHLIVDESKVMTVLKMLADIKQKSKIYNDLNMEIGNCMWADEPDAWFMRFRTTNGQWNKLIAMLKEQGYALVVDKCDRFCVKKGAEGL